MLKNQLKSLRLPAVSLVAGGMLALSGAAVANDGVAANEYAVSYSTTELVTQQGVEAVHERIVKAAKNYCPDYATSRSISEHRECIADVVADLVEKVANPALTNLHAGDDSIRIAEAEDTVAADRG